MNTLWPSIALRCAQVALTGWMLSLIASTVSFVRIPVATVEPWTAQPAPEQHSVQPIEHFASIAQRNLFQYKEGPARTASGPLPQTQLDVELVGTLLAGSAAGGSIALLRDARNVVHSVRENEQLPGSQVRVVGIEHRRIVIEHGGTLETVALESELAEQRVRAVKQALGITVVPPRPQAAPVPTPAAAAAASEGGILEALRAAATNVPATLKASSATDRSTPPEP